MMKKGSFLWVKFLWSQTGAAPAWNKMQELLASGSTELRGAAAFSG